MHTFFIDMYTCIKTFTVNYYCHYKLYAHCNNLTSLFLLEESVIQPLEPTGWPHKPEQVVKAPILFPFAVYLEII